MASRGDGLATADDGRKLYIPYAAPGDRVIVSVGAARGDGVEARIRDMPGPGPRREPVCPHFTKCGGCSTQHLPDDNYGAWKRDILVTALAQRGLTPMIKDLVRVPLESRRRVTFNAFKGAAGLVLGFMERRNRQVVEIDECPLLLPELNRLLSPLRNLLADILALGERGRVAVAGIRGSDGMAIDVILEWDGTPELAERERLAAFAEEQNLARLSIRDSHGLIEPVVGRLPVTAQFGGCAVALPPGGFMQPSSDGEAILVTAVCRAVAGAERIIELYAGAGTFTLPMAADASVHAVDGDAGLIAALATAAGRSGLGGRVSTDIRDLADRPLLAQELATGLAGNRARPDTVVLDPPRAGALRQVEQIAQVDSIGCVVMVSCNPATFARDARVLVDGGFAMDSVLPIDQFLYSHHLECVAVFNRNKG